jgi:hypothetical protein
MMAVTISETKFRVSNILRHSLTIL